MELLAKQFANKSDTISEIARRCIADRQRTDVAGLTKQVFLGLRLRNFFFFFFFFFGALALLTMRECHEEKRKEKQEQEDNWKGPQIS
jgi:hypothetical protein